MGVVPATATYGRQLPRDLAYRTVEGPSSKVWGSTRRQGGSVGASGPRPVSGWWLLRVGHGDEGAVRPGQAGGDATGPLAGPVTALARSPVLAGPFPDRLGAEAAALTGCAGPSGLTEVAVVYGVRRPDGTLAYRPAPAELAWLAELGGLLDRLPAAWDTIVSDTAPRTTLVVELAAALFEAGLPIRDCDLHTVDDAGTGAGGGVCLTPAPGRGAGQLGGV